MFFDDVGQVHGVIPIGIAMLFTDRPQLHDCGFAFLDPRGNIGRFIAKLAQALVQKANPCGTISGKPRRFIHGQIIP